MPGTIAPPDIELIVENRRVGGGGGRPPDGGDGGDDDYGRRGRGESPSPRRFSTGIAIGMVSILMFFMALASAFLVLRHNSGVWVTVRLPWILWVNTAVLLGSSLILERARLRRSEERRVGKGGRCGRWECQHTEEE